jgi:hypothetical protein
VGTAARWIDPDAAWYASRVVRHRLAIGVVLGALVVARAPVARADDGPAPSAERIKSAAEEFDRGRRAYLAKEFDQAAVHFESAFRDAPRAETLRLAIRARREAKQLARAATLAAIAQKRYPNDAQTAALATHTLDEAGPALQEYDVACSAECGITADGRVVSQADALAQRIFLDAGPHDLGVSFRTGSVSRHVEAKKGGRDALSFEAPAAPATPPATAGAGGGGAGGAAGAGGAGAGGAAGAAGGSAPGGEAAPGEAAPASHKPLGPVVFFVAAGVTLAAGAATVVSGIDTKNDPGVDAVRRECAGKDESCPAYEDGRASQLRTNILLGASLGAAAVTAVIGLFFTDWHGSAPAPARATVGLAPSRDGAAVSLSGRF